VKICIVTQQLGSVFSGIGLHSRILIEFLSKEGHSITVIVPRSQKPAGKCSYRIVTVNDARIFKSQARWAFLSIQFSNAIKKLEKTNDFDLIHFTDARDSFLCKTKTLKIGNINDTYPAELHPLKYYHENYIDWFQRWLYYRLMHFIESRKLLNLDYIIANSHYTYQTIMEQYQVPTSKIQICYKSVDIDRYKVIREVRKNEFLLQQNDLSILFVGGNMQRKGILSLIKSAKLLTKSWPGLKFDIVGNDKYIPQFKKICDSEGVSKHFHFWGWVSQDRLIGFYRSATIFVMPSLTEALGVVFLEAMAAGVPVIGTNVGGIPEIIINEYNGLLIPVNSPEKLSAAINRLIINQSMVEKITSNATQDVEKFSIKGMMECTKNVYSHIE